MLARLLRITQESQNVFVQNTILVLWTSLLQNQFYAI